MVVHHSTLSTTQGRARLQPVAKLHVASGDTHRVPLSAIKDQNIIDLTKRSQAKLTDALSREDRCSVRPKDGVAVCYSSTSSDDDGSLTDVPLMPLELDDDSKEVWLRKPKERVMGASEGRVEDIFIYRPGPPMQVVAVMSGADSDFVLTSHPLIDQLVANDGAALITSLLFADFQFEAATCIDCSFHGDELAPAVAEDSSAVADLVGSALALQRKIPAKSASTILRNMLFSSAMGISCALCIMRRINAASNVLHFEDLINYCWPYASRCP